MVDISTIAHINVVDISAGRFSLSPAGYATQSSQLARQSFRPAIIAGVVFKVCSNPAVHFDKCRLPALPDVAGIKRLGSVAFPSIPTTTKVLPGRLQVAAL
jgi:hypothetical protein